MKVSTPSTKNITCTSVDTVVVNSARIVIPTTFGISSPPSRTMMSFCVSVFTNISWATAIGECVGADVGGGGVNPWVGWGDG